VSSGIVCNLADCIKYCQSKKGSVIVSNDLYRDNWKDNDKLSGGEKQALRRWFKEHLISYTFVGDEFLPNPDFYFPAVTA
jgi:hypothetical protein